MVTKNTLEQEQRIGEVAGGDAAALDATGLPAPAARQGAGRIGPTESALRGASDQPRTDWVVMGGLIVLVAIVAAVMLTVVVIGGNME